MVSVLTDHELVAVLVGFMGHCDLTRFKACSQSYLDFSNTLRPVYYQV